MVEIHSGCSIGRRGGHTMHWSLILTHVRSTNINTSHDSSTPVIYSSLLPFRIYHHKHRIFYSVWGSTYDIKEMVRKLIFEDQIVESTPSFYLMPCRVNQILLSTLNSRL